MRCSFCGYEDSKVLDSRPVEDGRSIRRRRECQRCGKRFTTYERVEEMSLLVVKRDGSREIFDKNKILAGLVRACDKRPVPMSTLEDMVADIEKELRNSMEKEVTAKQIGDMVMVRLRQVDDVAYVRFASVYRKFEDIETFMKEIHSMMAQK
ncbi:MAG TPA: transcriptional repressor NrdR [Candidatus Avidehalobacter gallistercoris]|uniref:Transcriptional repressor NrdR n=1 Tax=Candidatus Avidehalobacter gallistercoris TaxID=2840694 RepID=A0A9D1KYT7_9FIRM|nr:transcriptional repressor NrdR [Candidatus Avidehalobacter gallistercoris]